MTPPTTTLAEARWSRQPLLPIGLLAPLPGFVAFGVVMFAARALFGPDLLDGPGSRVGLMLTGFAFVSVSYAVVRGWYAAGNLRVRVDGAVLHVGDQAIAADRIARIEHSNRTATASVRRPGESEPTIDAVLHVFGPGLRLRLLSVNNRVEDFERALAPIVAANPSIDLVPIELFTPAWR